MSSELLIKADFGDLIPQMFVNEHYNEFFGWDGLDTNEERVLQQGPSHPDYNKT